MLHRLRLIFALVFSFCLCLPVFAEEVSFEAHTPTIVGEGEPFRIEFILNTKPDLFNPPASFGGFDILAGPSTAEGRSVQIINGKVTQSVSITYTYVLQGNKIGKFTIPGAVARVDGKTYTTKSQTIEVVAAEGMSQQRGNGTSSSPSSRSAIRNGRGIAADDILIRVYVNRNQVYNRSKRPLSSIHAYRLAASKRPISLPLTVFGLRSSMWMVKSGNEKPTRVKYTIPESSKRPCSIRNSMASSILSRVP